MTAFRERERARLCEVEMEKKDLIQHTSRHRTNTKRELCLLSFAVVVAVARRSCPLSLPRLRQLRLRFRHD